MAQAGDTRPESSDFNACVETLKEGGGGGDMGDITKDVPLVELIEGCFSCCCCCAPFPISEPVSDAVAIAAPLEGTALTKEEAAIKRKHFFDSP